MHSKQIYENQIRFWGDSDNSDDKSEEGEWVWVCVEDHCEHIYKPRKLQANETEAYSAFGA